MAEGAEAVVARIREKATPTDEEETLLDRVVRQVIERAAGTVADLSIDADVLQVGSTARDTWVSGDHDVDVFVRFPPNLDRTDLERYGLCVGNAVLPDGREEYAEHPYVTGELCGVAVDLVPCYRVERASEIESAVDRTPFHSEYIEHRLDDRLAADVRVAKTFLSAVGIYGSDLRTRGFSGYLTELLVLAYDGFLELIEAATDWSPPITIDPAHHGERSFDDPLTVIDPTDPYRNVAAVLSTTQFARFQHHARELLAAPDESLFVPHDPDPLSAAAVREAVAARETTPIALSFTVPDLVPDQLYPQLEKSSAGIGRALDDRGFRVLRRDAFAADGDSVSNDECVLLFELAVATRPAIERHEGPPVSVREHARSFCSTYAGTDAYGPFIDGDRYVVEREREFTNAVAFLESDALFGVSLGADVETALNAEYDSLVGDRIADLVPEFGTEFARYFSPRP